MSKKEEQKKEEAPKIKCAVVPSILMQQMIDAMRDHVPHKVADPILQAVQTVQYGSFNQTTN